MLGARHAAEPERFLKGVRRQPHYVFSSIKLGVVLEQQGEQGEASDFVEQSAVKS